MLWLKVQLLIALDLFIGLTLYLFSMTFRKLRRNPHNLRILNLQSVFALSVRLCLGGSSVDLKIDKHGL